MSRSYRARVIQMKAWSLFLALVVFILIPTVLEKSKPVKFHSDFPCLHFVSVDSHQYLVSNSSSGDLEPIENRKINEGQNTC